LEFTTGLVGKLVAKVTFSWLEQEEDYDDDNDAHREEAPEPIPLI